MTFRFSTYEGQIVRNPGTARQHKDAPFVYAVVIEASEDQGWLPFAEALQACRNALQQNLSQLATTGSSEETAKVRELVERLQYLDEERAIIGTDNGKRPMKL